MIIFLFGFLLGVGIGMFLMYDILHKSSRTPKKTRRKPKKTAPTTPMYQQQQPYYFTQPPQWQHPKH